MLIIGLTGSIATGKSTVSAILGAPPNNIPVIDADVLAREAVEPGTHAYRRIVEYFEPIVAAESGVKKLRSAPLSESESGSESKGSGSEQAEAEAEVEAEAEKKNDDKRSGDDLFLPYSFTSLDPQQQQQQQQQQQYPEARPLNRATLSRLVFGSTPEHVRRRQRLNSIVHPAVRRAMVAALLQCYFSGCWAVVLDVPLLFESGWDILCGTVVVVAVSDKAVQMRRLCGRDREKKKKEKKERNKDENDNEKNGERGADDADDTEEEEKEKEEQVKGRISSQGGVLGKVARVFIREGLDIDIDDLVRDTKRQREKKRKSGVLGRGWGVVLWNDDNVDNGNYNDDDYNNNNHDDEAQVQKTSGQESKSESANVKDLKQAQIDRLRKDVNAMVRQLERQSPQWWAWTLLACPPLAMLVAAWSCGWSYWARKKWEGNGNERRRQKLEEMERDMLDRAKLRRRKK